MTKTPRIILHNQETGPMADQLRAAHPAADFTECHSYEDLPGLIDSYAPEIVYSVRFAGTESFPRDALFGSGGPSWVANGGAGTDHYGSWDPAKTTVTNTAGVAAGMMAEYIMGAFLHFSLDIPGLQQDKAAKVWNARTVSPLSGKTLLIVGLGNTGRQLAARAKAFGMTILGTRARPTDMQNVDEVHPSASLSKLLPRADFLAVCTPLLPETRGLLNATRIQSIRPHAVLADVSRGGVVDQSALYDALKSGGIAGAALDVFETEPLPKDSPLWALDNVIISPHCSSVYDGWEAASFQMFLENLSRWMRGEELKNIVDPTRGY